MKIVICKLILTIFLYNYFLTVFAQKRTRQRVSVQYCNTPDNRIGVCTTLNNCPSVGLIFAQGNRSPQTIQYIKGLQRNCGTRSINGDPVVCCQQAYRGRQRITTQPPAINRPVATRQPQRITQPPTINRPVATRRPQRTTQPPTINRTVATRRPQRITTQASIINRPVITTLPPIRISTAPPIQISTTSPYVNPSLENIVPTSLYPNLDVIPSTEDTVPLPIPTSLPPTPETRTNQFCVGPDEKEGTCKALQQCPALISALSRRRTDPEFVEFLRYSNKICESTYSYVCCPGEETEMRVTPSPVTTSNPINNSRKQNLFINRLPSVEDGCGQTNITFKRIVGGTVTKLGTWPWIALLGYGAFDEIAFRCGGSLITQKHVLTAAHCLRSDLILVRLGEHDLTTDTETKHIDIRIERKERHSKYSPFDAFADIAILYLEQTVQFTDLVKPICLPKSIELRSMSYVDYSPFVAGWGKTQENGISANILQQLQVPVFENSLCIKLYQKARNYFSNRQFDNSVICAGILEGGKDTCQGDSGGPLVLPGNVDETSYFYQIGVVSHSIGCARPEIPSAYTSVPYFMDWIEKRVSETL